MNFIEAAVFILIFAIISVPLANRFRLPLEVFLVIGSCVISLLPGLPQVQINPMIVFDIFLPPILFSAAYFTSWRDFKFNIRPITLLAFGLVLCNTVVIAVVARYCLPGFSWAEGFLLGAIISPTDASATTSIIKKLGAPRRLTSILEGESMVNDATGLIVYRFSLAAVLTGAFSFGDAIGDFCIIASGGVLIGLLVGYVGLRIIHRIKEVSAETTFTFIMAFTSYLLAEELGFSGVISTVVCGLYFGIYFPESASSQTRMHSKASWRTLMFIIYGFVFALIGLQLPEVLKSLETYSFSTLLYYGGLISLSVILVRLIWVYPAAIVPRLFFPGISVKDPMPPWQMLFAIGWAGMRGILSLAAVLAIPHNLSGGEHVLHRDLLIFITYCVVVATLILPSLTIPFVLRILNLSGTENKLKEEAMARIKAMEGIIGKVNEIAAKEKIPHDILEDFRKTIERKLHVIRSQIDATTYSQLSDEYFAIKKLTIAALESERETLIRLRREGDIHEDVFHSLMDELDIEEMRTMSLRI